MTACPRPACAPPHQVASLDRAASGQPRHMSKIHTGSFKTVSASARRFRAPCDLKLAHMDRRWRAIYARSHSLFTKEPTSVHGGNAQREKRQRDSNKPACLHGRAGGPARGAGTVRLQHGDHGYECRHGDGRRADGGQRGGDGNHDDLPDRQRQAVRLRAYAVRESISCLPPTVLFNYMGCHICISTANTCCQTKFVPSATVSFGLLIIL